MEEEGVFWRVGIWDTLEEASNRLMMSVAIFGKESIDTVWINKLLQQKTYIWLNIDYQWGYIGWIVTILLNWRKKRWLESKGVRQVGRTVRDIWRKRLTTIFASGISRDYGETELWEVLSLFSTVIDIFIPMRQVMAEVLLSPSFGTILTWRACWKKPWDPSRWLNA